MCTLRALGLKRTRIWVQQSQFGLNRGMPTAHRLRFTTVLLLGSLLTLMAMPALAQVSDAELDEITAALRSDGYYIEPGSQDSADGLSKVLEEADAQLYVVSFAADRGEDEGIIADRIAGDFTSGSFIVLTPVGVGYASNDFFAPEMDDALDAAEGNWGLLADGMRKVDRSLSGKGGFPVGKAVLAVIVGGFGLLFYKNRKRDKTVKLSRLEEARAGIREQVNDVSNDILSLSDRVAVADNDEATNHYRKGSEIFSGVADAVGTVTTEMELSNLSAELTEAEWSLESAQAILDGRPIPEKPKDRPVECFFHAHRAGIEKADVKTAAGSKAVSVCRDCGERLRRGERPEASTVSVGGRRVPRSIAPRSYGGGGFDAMDAFEIIVAGGGARYSNWGTGRSTVRRGNSRPSSRRATSRRSSPSRPTSRSSSRSRSSSSKSRGSRRRR
jgi:hypothetical protein